MPGSLNVTGGIRQLFDAADRTEPDPGDSTNPELWRDGAAWFMTRGLGGGFDARMGNEVMSRGGAWEMPDRSYGTSGWGEYKHLKHKTIPWNFAPRLTPLATDTTLGTATRHDTAPITIYMPETAERVIASVKLLMTFRTENTAGTISISAVRMGIQIGAGPTLDFDKPHPIAPTTTRQYFDVVDQDITDYARRWLTGTSHSAVASIAVQTSAATNINLVTFKLVITYGHAPTTGTRLKCIRIPIQSHAFRLTNVQQELGVDGISPVPSGQIPALDTFLPEVSKTYRQITFCIVGNDGLGAGLTYTPQIQIDATAEVPRATLTMTLAGTLQYMDTYELLGVITTNATHTISMRADTTLSDRIYWMGGWLEVVYEYNHASTLANNLAMYEAIVPLAMGDDMSPGSQVYASAGGGSLTLVDSQCVIANLDIQEPGPITLAQSAVMWIANVSSASTPWYCVIGNSPQRVWTPLTSMGPTFAVQRVDVTGGWTLKRGRNRLPAFLWNQLGRTTPQMSYAIINYTAGVRVDVDNGMHPVQFNVDDLRSVQAASTSIDISPQNAYTRIPQLGAPYRINSMFAELWAHAGAGINACYGIEQQEGERDGLALFGNGVSLLTTNQIGNSIASAFPCVFALTGLFNQDNLHRGKLDVERPRRQMLQSNSGALAMIASWWITYHQHTYTVGGTVTVNGVAVGAGKVIEVWAKESANFNLPADLLTTVTTAVGGTFTVEVPDNTRTYFVTYNNDSNYGRSKDGVPGTDVFDVGVGGTGAGGYSRSRVVNI